jgi:hypothetical protein
MPSKKTVKKTKKVAIPKQPHLFLATPMYGGMCHGAFTQGIISLVQACDKAGVKLSISFMFNESLIQRARNALVHNALKTDFTHFMFIDADIRFQGHDVLTMMQVDKPLIAGIYPKKEINWSNVAMAAKAGMPDLHKYTGSFVVNLEGYVSEVTVPVNKPLKVLNAGTGFMLIKRHVFDDIRRKMKPPTYVNDVVDLTGNVKPGEQITAFFDCSIEEGTNRLLSEDYHFCQLYRKAGGSVLVAPWVNLAHIGSYIFEGGFLPAD